jgi:hypothetical protein
MSSEQLAKRIASLEDKIKDPAAGPAFMYLFTSDFHNREEMDHWKEDHPAGKYILVDVVDGKRQTCWKRYGEDIEKSNNIQEEE